ncbi:MAG TPA: AAA family ATPase [Victivallales bacterium]|nr:AAA family ATPase [Victivallales bacterium]
MIIVLGGKKGGTGKSTIATNLAVSISNKDKSVLLIDADPQETSYEWYQARIENEKLSNISATQGKGNIKRMIIDFKDKYDFIIIDTHGGDSTEQRTACLAADIFLMPVRPSFADVSSLSKQLSNFEELLDLNERLKLYCLLSQCPTNIKMKDKKDALEVLIEFPYINILECNTSWYKVYWKALECGMGVGEYDKKHKASKEIEKLVEEIA